MTDLMADQAGDFFRIGLLAMLMLTTLRNRPVTGLILPLIAGAIFVAVLIPVSGVSERHESTAIQILTGLLINAVYLAIGLASWSLWRSRRG